MILNWTYMDPSGLAAIHGRHEHNGTWEEDEFLWTEGNYACDCNRALLFFGFDNFPCGESYFFLEDELNAQETN